MNLQAHHDDRDPHRRTVLVDPMSPVEQQSALLHPAVSDARAVIEVETAALAALAESVGGDGAASVAGAVDLIHGCRGRAIVTGMGKSGLVGRKIAATLASTGTAAHFVHPAEASHGDLGMIAGDDVVLALSKSGETPELNDLLFYTKNLGIPLVAMTAQATSSLGRAADLLLLIPPVPEACPIGCAPTTSTTVMLAFGDALAIALMRRNAFTPQDFRLRHPGGKLGRRLTRVEEVMHGGDALPLVHLDATVTEMLLEMTRTGFGATGVIDDHGLLVGAITHGDLQAHRGTDFALARAGQFMGPVPVEIRPEMLVEEASRVMAARGVPTAIVTEGARPIGILHVDDLRRAEAA